jgi:hypothetical protein
MNKEVRIRGYFSQSRAIGEQKCLGSTALGNQHKCVQNIGSSFCLNHLAESILLKEVTYK